MARSLAKHIQAFDLESAKACKSQGSGSLLETSLFHIVSNLESYRPFLPDHLFQSKVCICGGTTGWGGVPLPGVNNTSVRTTRGPWNLAVAFSGSP